MRGAHRWVADFASVWGDGRRVGAPRFCGSDRQLRRGALRRWAHRYQ